MSLWTAGVVLAVYFALFTGFAFVAAAHCKPRGLMATLTFVECAALAGAVALFAVGRDPREVGVIRFLLGMAVVCVAGLAASTATLVIAWAVWGATPLDGALVAQIVILSFCVLLWAVFALVRCSGSELLFAQLVCIFTACVLMGTVFYADPIIEAQKSPQARNLVIHAVLSTNPMTAISWSLLEFDLMHRPVMYGRISVIGDHWYLTLYPDWWKTSLGYLVLSAVMFAGAALLRRHRGLRRIRKGGG